MHSSTKAKTISSTLLMIFRSFFIFVVDFALWVRYLESPDSTLLRCGQKAAASKLGTNAVLPVSRLRVLSGAFLFLAPLVIICLSSCGDGFLMVAMICKNDFVLFTHGCYLCAVFLSPS